MEPLLVTVNLLAAKVARATDILQAMEEATEGLLAMVHRAIEALQAMELTINTPCPHLIHRH